MGSIEAVALDVNIGHDRGTSRDIDPPQSSILISTFTNTWDVAPKRVQCTVGGLLRALSTFPVLPVADKRALPAWSPAIFATGASRRADAVLEVGCLVLDVDAGDPDAAFDAWPGLIALMHTTWSHHPGAPRYRLVLPLARPVPAARWGQAWAWAAAKSTGPTRRARTRPGCTSAPRCRGGRVQTSDGSTRCRPGILSKSRS